MKREQRCSLFSILRQVQFVGYKFIRAENLSQEQRNEVPSFVKHWVSFEWLSSVKFKEEICRWSQSFNNLHSKCEKSDIICKL